MPSSKDGWWSEPIAPERESLGRRLMHEREAMGERLGREVTQEEVGQAVGVGSTAVSRWERDVSLPETPRLEGLAEFFGVDFAELRRLAADQVYEKHFGPESGLRLAGLPGPALAVPDRPEVRAVLSVLETLDWAQFAHAAEVVRAMPKAPAPGKGRAAEVA